MRVFRLPIQYSNQLGIAIFLALILAPLIAGLGYAAAYSSGFVGVLSSGFTTAHWQAVLYSVETWYSLLLSAGVAVAVVTSSAVMALSAVLYWSQQLDRKLSGYLIYFPLAIPPLTMSFLVFQWLGQSGLIMRVAVASGLISGIEEAPVLINDSWHIGVMVALSGLTTPFLIILFLQYSRAENVSHLLQIAYTLGASRRQAIFSVAIPVLLRRALPNMGLSCIFLFGAYEAPLLLGQQSPRMISVLIAQKFHKFNLSDVPQAYALTILYAGIVGLAAWWFFRRMHRLSGIRNTIIVFFLSTGTLSAQGPFDGYFKGKGKIDIAPSFSSNTFNEFEGVNNQIFDINYKGYLLSFFAEYGLSENIDLIGTGAYTITPTKDGLQDGGIFVKYRYLKYQLAHNYILHATVGSGLSFPLSDYEPTANGALGTKAITLPARFILQLETPPGLFINLTGGYNWRFDRASAADIAAVRRIRPDFNPQRPPNYTSLLLKIGFPAAHYYLDAWLEWQHTQGGANFVPDVSDLPQLYGVSYLQIGGTAYYSDNGKTGFYLSTGYILDGRNVGKILRITGGLVFKINTKKR